MRRTEQKSFLQKWEEKYNKKLNEVNKRVAANKPPPYDETVFMNEALRMLRDAVHFDKKKYQYQIRQQTSDKLRMLQQSYKVKRLIKLRFRCQNKACQSYKEIVLRGIRCNQSRKWTSYFGIVMLIFDLKYGPNGLSIVYSLKVFKQLCMQCKQWGISGFYQSGLNSILDLFRLIIRNVLKNSNGPKAHGFRWTYLEKNGLKPVIYNGGRGHQFSLCQGCHQKECINYYQQKQSSGRSQYDEQDQYFSDSSSQQKQVKQQAQNFIEAQERKRQTLQYFQKMLDKLKRQTYSSDKRSYSNGKFRRSHSNLPWSDESKSIQDTGEKRKRKNWQLKE